MSLEMITLAAEAKALREALERITGAPTNAYAQKIALDALAASTTTKEAALQEANDDAMSYREDMENMSKKLREVEKQLYTASNTCADAVSWNKFTPTDPIRWVTQLRYCIDAAREAIAKDTK